MYYNIVFLLDKIDGFMKDSKFAWCVFQSWWLDNIFVCRHHFNKYGKCKRKSDVFSAYFCFGRAGFGIKAWVEQMQGMNQESDATPQWIAGRTGTFRWERNQKSQTLREQQQDLQSWGWRD